MTYNSPVKYIDLNSICEEHIRGNWEVYNRVLNTNSEDNIFADVRLLEMSAAEYKSRNGVERIGKWKVIKESEIIYNPQIKFYINDQEVGNAIITRLIAETASKGEQHKLTLYFSTGLELVLRKTA